MTTTEPVSKTARFDVPEVVIYDAVKFYKNRSVPPIKNRIIGIIDGETDVEVGTNFMEEASSGYNYYVNPESISGDVVKVEVSTSGRIFQKQIKIQKFIREGQLIGGLISIPFERKFWIDNNQMSLKIWSSTSLLYEKEFHFSPVKYGIFYEKENQNPFVITRLGTGVPGKRYIFRYDNTGKPIIVIYKSIDWEYYTYLMSFQNERDSDGEIEIEFNEPNTIYHFGVYAESEIPTGETTKPVFDYIQISE